MYTQLLKSLALPLIIAGIILVPALSRPATAAPMEQPVKAIGPLAQASGITLEKKAGAESVPLGQVVSYTVTIKNEGRETIQPTLTDALPAGLALQTRSISATMGSVTASNNTVSWSGRLAQGEAVTIVYNAIPPSTSPPDQTLKNVASLQLGGRTLEAAATITTTVPQLSLWGRFVNFIALALVFFDNVLSGVRIPYSFGFAIIIFTVIVRLATFPLNMQQIKSSKAMQELQPKLKELQEKYKNDREKLAQEQMALYKAHGVNPLGGCLPMVVQMPIWLALYRSLLQLSHEGLLNEGFFWIPSLAGPVAERGGGIGWLWPLPPSIGWGPALAYLVLPVLLVVSQLYMQQMMMPANPDPQQSSMNSVMKFMPFMFGYFALIVPSGLSLYWFTSNLLAVVQQYFTKTQLTPASSGAPVNAPPSANPVAVNPVSSNSPPASPGESAKSKKDATSKRKKSRRKR